MAFLPLLLSNSIYENSKTMGMESKPVNATPWNRLLTIVAHKIMRWGFF